MKQLIFFTVILSLLILSGCSQDNTLTQAPLANDSVTPLNLTPEIEIKILEAEIIVPKITGEANPNFPYWDHSNISYSFDLNNSCEPNEKTADAYQKLPRIKQALKIINDETNGLITFYETETGGDITISCFDSIKQYESELLGEAHTLGLARPKILLSGKILSANIDFYRNTGLECWNYPTVELHEILHAFGLGDLQDPNYKVGIMYNGFAGGGSYCADLAFDKYLIPCLKNIYSNGEKGSSEACLKVPSIIDSYTFS